MVLLSPANWEPKILFIVGHLMWTVQIHIATNQLIKIIRPRNKDIPWQYSELIENQKKNYRMGLPNCWASFLKNTKTWKLISLPKKCQKQINTA